MKRRNFLKGIAGAGAAIPAAVFADKLAEQFKPPTDEAAHLSVNEIRAKEDLPPIRGDVQHIPPPPTPFGTSIQINGRPVGQVLSIDVQHSHQQISVTALSSTARKYVTGLHDLGTIEIKFYGDESAGQQEILKAHRTGEKIEFALLDSDAHVTTVKAVVTDLQWSANMEEPITCMAAIMFVGPVTVTA